MDEHVRPEYSGSRTIRANVPFHANPNTSPNAQREQICIFTNFPDVPWSAQPLGGCSISQNCRFFVKDNTQAAKMCLIDL